MTRTALNVARRKLRREGQEGRLWRRATAEVPVEAPPPMWPSDLWAALDALTPREREAMALRHVADLSTKDVATVMGVSQGTVSSTLHSARARLVAELAKEVTDV